MAAPEQVVVQTGTSSKHATQVRRLAAELPGVLRRTPRVKPTRQRRSQRRLAGEQVAQLVAEYQAGVGVLELAARWKVNRGTVAHHLARAGVELRRRGLSPGQIEEAVRLYGEGWSIRQVAARHGCDYETVRRALLRAKVKLRPPNGGQSGR
jgi:DNA-directed RNA polymerase specialized sigma24 family protein